MGAVKNSCLVALFVCWSSLSLPVLAQNDCDNAVDAAEAMNVNQTECDFSNQGLNGFLQKAFKKGEEGAVLSTGSDTPSAQQSASGAHVKQANASMRVEVDQWANVNLVRTQLLPKIMEPCKKGFSVISEQYRPVSMGRIELTIEYRCL